MVARDWRKQGPCDWVRRVGFLSEVIKIFWKLVVAVVYNIANALNATGLFSLRQLSGQIYSMCIFL